MRYQVPTTLCLALIASAAFLTACASDAALMRAQSNVKSLPDDQQLGWALVQDRCTACHTFTKVEKAIVSKPTAQEWEDLVEDMAERRGSPIKDHERAPIAGMLSRLSANYQR